MSESKSIIQYDKHKNECVISRLTMTNDDFVNVIKNIILDYNDIGTYEYTKDKNLDNKPLGNYLVHDVVTNELEFIKVDKIDNKGYFYNTVSRVTEQLYRWKLIDNKYHQHKLLNFPVEKTNFDTKKLNNKITSIVGSAKTGKKTILHHIIEDEHSNYDKIIYFVSEGIDLSNYSYFDDTPRKDGVTTHTNSIIRYLPLSALKNTFEYKQNDGHKYLVLLELSSHEKDNDSLYIINNNDKYDMTIIITSKLFEPEIMGKSDYVINLNNDTSDNLRRISKFYKFDTPFRKISYVHSQLQNYEAQVFDTKNKDISGCVVLDVCFE